MTAQRLTARRIQEALNQLTDLDMAILNSVSAVRMMTGKQLQRLHFPGGDSASRAARRQLRTLTARGLLTRLDRTVGGVRAGSSAWIYSLDRLGQRVMTGTGPANGRRIRRPWTPSTSFTAHVLAVAELSVRLAETNRAGTIELLEFQAEPHCWRSFAGPGGGRLILKPDAYVRNGDGHFEHLWFIEVDLGTESRAALTRKLRRYRQYWATGREQARTSAFPHVLLLANTDRRRQVLIEVAAAQPASSWKLFKVASIADAAQALRGHRGSSASDIARTQTAIARTQ